MLFYKLASGVTSSMHKAGPKGIKAKLGEALSKRNRKKASKAIDTASDAVKDTGKHTSEIVDGLNSVNKKADKFMDGVEDGFRKGGKSEKSTLTDTVKSSSKRQTPDQNALLNLAKEAKKNAKNGNPISYEEAKILDEWAKEYNVPQHHPAVVGSGQHFQGGNYLDHTHIYNIHVPYEYR